MKKLIEALTILSKYGDPKTNCVDGVLYVVGLNPDNVTKDDRIRLERLGFLAGENGFYSYKFGSD